MQDNHLCHCLDPNAIKSRAHLLTTISKSLKSSGTDPVLWSLLINGISTWFKMADTSIPMAVPNNHPFCAQLTQAANKQNNIGWDQDC